MIRTRCGDARWGANPRAPAFDAEQLDAHAAATSLGRTPDQDTHERRCSPTPQARSRQRAMSQHGAVEFR